MVISEKHGKPSNNSSCFAFEDTALSGPSGLLNSRSVCYSTPSRSETLLTRRCPTMTRSGDSSYRCSVDYFWQVGAKILLSTQATR